MEQKQLLPNSTTVLVLGICSIVFGCFFVGIVLGIIGIAMSGKGRKMYKENPDQYDGWGQLNAGFILSIIGVALSGIYLVYWLVVVAILGGTMGTLWQMSKY